MGYERLQEYVNCQDWTAAKREIESIRNTGNQMDDVLAILAAYTWKREKERRHMRISAKA